MLGIVLICGASFFIENCTVTSATIVLKAPGVFLDAETCQLDTMLFAEAISLAREGDVTRIICAYPPTKEQERK